MQSAAKNIVTHVGTARAAGIRIEPLNAGEFEPSAQVHDARLMVSYSSAKWLPVFFTTAIVALFTGSAAAAADLSTPTQAATVPASGTYDWTGFYVGIQTGAAWGKSKWNTDGGLGSDAGSMHLGNSLNFFNEDGSWFNGLQAGYNYQLPSHIVLGAETDARFPSYPSPITGIGIGGTSISNNTGLGYAQNILASGSVRARLGYAAGDWLLYTTGGLAWEAQRSYLATSTLPTTHDSGRVGWAAGGGVEVALSPHWSARAEYLYSGFGKSTTNFDLGAMTPGLSQSVTSNIAEQEIRLGVNYQFGGGGLAPPKVEPPAPGMESDRFNIHVETTGTWQGYPAFPAAYSGVRSLPAGGDSRETTELGVYLGARLWKDAEIWVEPEIDQGFGVANTSGLAGYSSAGAFKLGLSTPYARLSHLFVQQTFNFGGTPETIDPSLFNFGNEVSSNRLVLTIGKYVAPEIFGRNTYLNPKTDFINWSFLINLPYDFGGDAWTTTIGAAAEYYIGDWTFRAGFFDLSAGPSGGDPASQLGAFGLDEDFKQYNLVGEIERRYNIWGQPGKIKLLGYNDHGMMGKYSDAVALWQSQGGVASGANPDTGLVRQWADKQGVSLNWEQQISKGIGVFVEAGWMNGAYEVFDTSDVDRSLIFGTSIDGDRWSRPGDRFGIAGAVNGISKQYATYLNDGGLGVLIGDGQLPHPRTENIIEAFYRYQINPAIAFTIDYQFIDNPAYNPDRGPVNLFGCRLYAAF